MSIRMLTAGDRGAWDRLWRGYLEFYRAALPDAVTELTWTRLLDPDEPMHALGIFRDGALIGFAHILFHRSTWSEGPYCYLEDLYVVGEMRWRGAGRLLIEEVQRMAREAGASQVYWLTHETNHQAMVLYDKVAKRSGFVHYRSVPGC